MLKSIIFSKEDLESIGSDARLACENGQTSHLLGALLLPEEIEDLNEPVLFYDFSNQEFVEADILYSELAPYQTAASCSKLLFGVSESVDEDVGYLIICRNPEGIAGVERILFGCEFKAKINITSASIEEISVCVEQVHKRLESRLMGFRDEREHGESSYIYSVEETPVNISKAMDVHANLKYLK